MDAGRLASGYWTMQTRQGSAVHGMAAQRARAVAVGCSVGPFRKVVAHVGA